MLIVFSGLPGTGKTTIARTLAPHLAATYLRIDSIEQGLRDAGLAQVGKAGYQIALQLAEANLALGNRVLADCVNPVQESRQAWQALASRQGVRLLEIEVVCSILRSIGAGSRPASWTCRACARPAGNRCSSMTISPGRARRCAWTPRSSHRSRRWP